MPNSAYKVIDIIGSSDKSWEDATRNAISTASESIKHPRVAEVKEHDVTIDESGKITAFRVKISLSFKYGI
ncbi:dodecin family protein [Aquisalimonas sp.]|uniref:dodecin family protein n=1 Tax=Aquisalimonas sp. TaxID=1872621 RepID=UPI0025C722A5|nr:dodecin family protein [Aquisalimonas sp.]